MAKFDLPNDVFTEDAAQTKQFFKDAAKGVANIDVDEISDAWKSNSNNTGLDKANGYLKVIDKVGRDVTTPISKVNDFINDNKVDNRSLFARARNSILYFPVYVSQSIRANEAHVMSQMFERVYASLVQSVLSQNPIINEEDIKDMKFLTKFHTNIKEAAENMTNVYYEPIDETDAMMKESVFYHQQLTENCDVTFTRAIVDDSYFLAEHTRLMNDPLTGFPYLLMEAKTTKSNKSSKEPPSEKDIDNIRKNAETNRKIDEAEVGLRRNERIDYSSTERALSDDDIVDIVCNMQKINADEVKLYKQSKDAVTKDAKADAERFYSDEEDKRTDHVASKLDEKDIVDEKINKYINDFKQNVRKSGDAGYNGYFYKNGRIIKISRDKKVVEKRNQVDRFPDIPQILKDNEIKKINAATPLMMSATFRVKLDNGNDREVKFVIGIKSTLHLINPKDLGEDLQEIVTGKIKSLQKVRYKTGEISFKDYIFNPKGLKKDAAKRIQYNKRWVNTLKRLADYRDTYASAWNKPASLLNNGKIPIPNGTLILSQADVTALSGETGVDLSTVSNAKRLAFNLFLIAVVIVDASAGTLRILYPDSSDEWEIQSLSSIESEIAKSDNSSITRELMRVVNR